MLKKNKCDIDTIYNYVYGIDKYINDVIFVSSIY